MPGFEPGPSMAIREEICCANDYATGASYASTANILQMVQNQTCTQNVIPPPPPPPSLNASVILTEVILIYYNILDAPEATKHNPPPTSIALENSIEFQDNIMVLNFGSVHIS